MEKDTKAFYKIIGCGVEKDRLKDKLILEFDNDSTHRNKVR